MSQLKKGTVIVPQNVTETTGFDCRPFFICCHCKNKTTAQTMGIFGDAQRSWGSLFPMIKCVPSSTRFPPSQWADCN